MGFATATAATGTSSVMLSVFTLVGLQFFMCYMQGRGVVPFDAGGGGGGVSSPYVTVHNLQELVTMLSNQQTEVNMTLLARAGTNLDFYNMLSRVLHEMQASLDFVNSLHPAIAYEYNETINNLRGAMTQLMGDMNAGRALPSGSIASYTDGPLETLRTVVTIIGNILLELNVTLLM